VKYAFCNCTIKRFDKVLYVYAAGDCDTGVIHDYDPFDGFGTVHVYLKDASVTCLRALVESVVHFDCLEDNF
jgi:hypothetical protein